MRTRYPAVGEEVETLDNDWGIVVAKEKAEWAGKGGVLVLACWPNARPRRIAAWGTHRYRWRRQARWYGPFVVDETEGLYA